MRISEQEFRRKPLRAHTFLNGVPLHDVWLFRLPGGGDSRTLGDFKALWQSSRVQQVNPFVSGLFKLRSTLGKRLGWDKEKVGNSGLSYIHRLNESDRTRSLDKPGSPSIGPFRCVYSFDNEALDEVINGTVHAFSLMAMEPSTNGYTVFWAIYVKKINWFTPLYMAMIAPFRRLIVYPTIIRKMERSWVFVYGGQV